MVRTRKKINRNYARTTIRTIRLSLLLIFLFTCSSNFYAEEESSLFWPPPPAEIRIIFVKSIYSPKDVGVKPTFFKKFKRLIAGEEEDILSRPVAITVDGQGTIYVCDPGAPAVYIFNQKEKRYKKISTVNHQALLSPVGIAVNKTGLVFISDSKLKRVFCLNKNGQLRFVIGEDESLLRPTGLAADEEKLYVVDTATHRVSLFDFNGHLINGFGQRGKKDGEFNYPTSITVDTEGKIYVVDTLNFRIQVFDKKNNFLYSIGRAGDSSGSFSRPKGIAVDSFGHIYSTDGLSDNVQIFSQKKEFLLSLGESGHKSGEFWIVSGIAIDEKNYIYVADSYNQRLQVFRYVGKE